ncbi:Transposon Ty3-I Gag-Pol polyprotein [Orchesella cincta]|uniref:RNA-directed DNA polymerase n=1 Tax=Orchesella cincta TaxID=48709 RepID=A0A1D2M490_ORCCI|nr:Transposon Ty3-I Gag-Pol polyprotein [Orchesella cincta]
MKQYQHFKHHINTGYSAPTQCKQFKLSEREHEVINDKCKELITKKIIEPSSSPWSSNCFLVPKRNDDGSLTYNLHMDYSSLNKLTQPNQKKLPNVDSIFMKLQEAKFISCLQLASSYHRVPLDDESKEKTSFVTRDNLYHWNVLPYGIHDAPNVFAQLYADSLLPVTDQELTVFNDVIFVFTQTEEQHLKKMNQLLECLRDNQMYINLGQSKFFFSEINFAGHNIQQQAVIRMGWDVKDVKFHWKNEHQLVFENLKKTLSTAPVLSRIYPESELILRTDASIEGIGSCLSEKRNGVEKPVCFLSRLSIQAEKQYSITALELLAVVWSLEKLRHLVFQRKLKCFTDHKAITYLHKGPKNHLPSGLVRMLLSLEEYDVDFYHVAGNAHEVPDTLSRFPVYPPVPETPNIVDVPLLSIGFDNLDQMQNNDNEIQKLKRNVKSELRTVENEHLFLKNNVLFKTIPLSNRATIVVPSNLRPYVINNIHEDPIEGHLSDSQTFRRMASSYYWPSMKQDISTFVRSCCDCQTSNQPDSVAVNQIIYSQRHQERADISCAVISPSQDTDHTFYRNTLNANAVPFVPLSNMQLSGHSEI